MYRAEINMTPMIDVLLVLMIVFMLAQIQTRMVLNVTIPSPVMPEGSSAPAPIVLQIGADGSYALNGSPVERPTLASRLREVFESRPRSVLFIKTAPARVYREVIDVVDVAKGAGVAIVSFMPNP